jgi:hypothetical protein
MILPLLVAGCVNGSLEALCDASRANRANLATALADSPDDTSVVYGARLINQIDSACGKGN